MKTQKLTSKQIDRFFSKERPVFLRNVSDMLVSLSLASVYGEPMHFLISKERGWKRLDAPFDAIKNSSDLKKFLLKDASPIQLWLGTKPPGGYKLLEQNCAFEVVGLPVEEKVEMPPVDPDVVHPVPAREVFEIMTFNKVFEAFSEERETLVTQIEFHQKSLKAAEDRFSETDSIHGVLKWLKENIFDEDPKKLLIRNALCGKDQPSAGGAADYTLPRTYSALKEWVSAISANGRYANLQERFRAYNEGFRHGRVPSGERVEPASLHTKRGERASKVARTLRSVKKAEKKVETRLRKKPAIIRGTFPCDQCSFTSPTANGLGAHRYQKHGVRGRKHEKRVVRAKAEKE